MQILVTVPFDPARRNDPRFMQIIECLSRQHKIHILCVKELGRRSRVQAKLHYVTESDMTTRMQKWATFFRINRMLSELPEIDVHFSYNSIFLHYMIQRYLKKNSIRTVYDISEQPLSFLENVLLKKNMKKTGFTISPDGFMDTKIVPNGFDAGKFRPKVCRNKYVTIGNASDEKDDFSQVLKALKQLDEYKMKLVFHKDLNIPADILAGENIKKYISKLDIAVVPKGSPLPYMAMEKPVISSRKIGNALVAKSVPEWVRQISLLYHDKVFREKLGKEGRQFVIENYSWKKTCSRIEKLLKEVSEEE